MVTSGSICIVLLMLFLVYDLVVAVPTITVEKIILSEAEPVNKIAFIREYEIKESDMRRLVEKDICLRRALITVKCDNPSFFNSFCDVRGIFAKPEKLPQIVVGEKPRMASEDLVDIYSRLDKFKHPQLNRTKFNIAVLIDPKEYNDAEILEMLKSVEVRFNGFGAGGKKELVTIPLGKMM